MNLYPILLLLAVIAADGGLTVDLLGERVDRLGSLLLTVLPAAAAVMTAWAAVRVGLSRLDRGDVGGVRFASRVWGAAKWFILINHFASLLLFRWLDTVRSVTGNLILVDELLCITPPLIALFGLWWAQYPMEMRLRAPMTIARLDTGTAPVATPGRLGFVLMHVRCELLLLLVPVLLIVAGAEAVDRAWWGRVGPEGPWWPPELGKVLLAATVFLFAPLISRVLLQVTPLPPGPVRTELEQVCRAHRVKVRELLEWNTHGAMINAAVMGLIGPLRYVLLTDAMLDLMSHRQVVAVMAHEVAHVRRHHMPWLVVVLLALVAATAVAPRLPLMLLTSDQQSVVSGELMPEVVAVVLSAGQLLVVLLAFGWISRRFERQADTFAAAHLSGGRDASVQAEAVESMQSALTRIAVLNHIDPDRRSWRHGSIGWRRDYLASIVGRPVKGLAIDRVVRRIKVAAAVVLAGSIVLDLWWPWADAGAGAVSPAASTWSAPPSGGAPLPGRAP